MAVMEPSETFKKAHELVHSGKMSAIELMQLSDCAADEAVIRALEERAAQMAKEHGHASRN